MKTIRIGSGAGYAGDRIDPAVDLVEHGNIKYICFEALAERTIAIALLQKQQNPEKGYGQFLEERMEAILPYCAEKGVVMISNLGAANPVAALKKTVSIANEKGIKHLKIGAVVGDDVLEYLKDSENIVWETGEPVKELKEKLISANAYLGVEAILPALRQDCNVIITGRVADPSLFLAPMVHEFGWDINDWHRLGAGTAIGHLLECSAQVTGGYFASPGLKDVPDLLNVGFPIAEVDEEGTAVITKLAQAGGMVTKRTCKEQLFYEIHDPSNYLTPDVTADFSEISLLQEAKDRVRVLKATGRQRPDDLKVSLGVKEGFIGEGEISFAGYGALERAKMSREIVKERIKKMGVKTNDYRAEIIGYNSLLGGITEIDGIEPLDVRLRVAAKVDTKRDAERIGEEVENLYLNGPAGPGGARKYVRPLIAAYSTTIPRKQIKLDVIIKEVV